MFNKLLHKYLKRPYQLYCRVDEGDGDPVVLLHGIAATGKSWTPVVEELKRLSVRILVFDLLGFGKSPKPTEDWAKYSAAEHANSVISSLTNKRPGGPVILVGHSMGCLIAVQIANQRPDLVKALILYQPAFYADLPEKNSFRLQQAASFKIYNKILKSDPTGSKYFSRAQRVLKKAAGFVITEETWVPFQRSLENTIMHQTAVNDLRKMDTPTKIIYGKYDQVVIRDTKKVFFGEEGDNIEVTALPGTHNISSKAAVVIAGSIMAELKK